MKEFIDTRIGKQVVPVDNSYQRNILTGASTSLAGSATKDPQLVTIISEPYYLSFTQFGNKYSERFVTVLHNGAPHVCLDNFYDSYDEAMDNHRSFLGEYADAEGERCSE